MFGCRVSDACVCRLIVIGLLTSGNGGGVTRIVESSLSMLRFCGRLYGLLVLWNLMLIRLCVLRLSGLFMMLRWLIGGRAMW